MQAERTIAPFGSWESPLTPEALVAGQVGLGAPRRTAAGLFWTETRPDEGGRSVLMRRAPDGTVDEVLAKDFSVRTRAHEYGGGAWAANDVRIVFSNDVDGRLHVLNHGEGEPCALTAPGNTRYADLAIDEERSCVFCVCEDHDRAEEPANELVRIPLRGGTPRALVTDRDFVAAPRLSPDGRQLAWLAWDHPNMPWDDSEIWLAELDDEGELLAPRRVAGGPGISVFQPEWSPDGVLHFVSDASGWWNLYALGPSGPQPLHPAEAEFGLPQWVFGMRTYDFVDAEEILCTWGRGGTWRLGRLNTRTSELTEIDTDFASFDGLRVRDGIATFAASRSDGPSAIVELDLASGESTIVRESGKPVLAAEYVSHPEALTIPTPQGATTHAFFYPPTHPAFEGPEGELPPLRVKSHGGPTGSAGTAFDPRIQFWTTRGFAVVDVNYRGSTGYGRAYRESLKGNWGLHDVTDCEAAALHLADSGRVDRARLTIQGGSAGGYTTLAALAFTDTFACGASHYGIGDLAALARDTHKFESRYTDALVAPWPQGADVYAERSPLEHADGLSCPVIFFQGLEDKVVPPNQAEAMVAALRAKGIRVEYVPLEGEAHGFRRADSIIRVMETELAFFREVLAQVAGPA